MSLSPIQVILTTSSTQVPLPGADVIFNNPSISLARCFIFCKPLVLNSLLLSKPIPLSQICRVKWVLLCLNFKRIASHCEYFNVRSEEHTSELQSQSNLVCRLLLEKKKEGRLADPDDGALARRLHPRNDLLARRGLSDCNHPPGLLPIVDAGCRRLTPGAVAGTLNC